MKKQEWELANVLVTGGTGQIGAYVSSELAQNGHAVTAFDFKPNPSALVSLKEKVEILTGDVIDLEELLSVMRSRNINHVVHLAAILVFESKQDPSRALKVNCVGTNNVFEAARLLNIGRVVFASSVVVYGMPTFYPSKKVNENDFPHCPNDPYSVTKFVNEAMGQFYRDSYGMDIICLRVTGAWGPGRYSGYTGQFNEFVRRAALEEQTTLPDDFAYVDAKLRWMYVKEMGSCFCYAALVDRRKAKRGLYNAGSREPFKSADLIREIRKYLPGAKIEYRESAAPTKQSSDIAGPSGLDVDCSRLYHELGFEEKFGLRKGVMDMVDYERSRAKLRPLSP